VGPLSDGRVRQKNNDTIVDFITLADLCHLKALYGILSMHHGTFLGVKRVLYEKPKLQKLKRGYFGKFLLYNADAFLFVTTGGVHLASLP